MFCLAIPLSFQTPGKDQMDSGQRMFSSIWPKSPVTGQRHWNAKYGVYHVGKKIDSLSPINSSPVDGCDHVFDIEERTKVVHCTVTLRNRSVIINNHVTPSGQLGI